MVEATFSIRISEHCRGKIFQNAAYHELQAAASSHQHPRREEQPTHIPRRETAQDPPRPQERRARQRRVSAPDFPDEACVCKRKEGNAGRRQTPHEREARRSRHSILDERRLDYAPGVGRPDKPEAEHAACGYHNPAISPVGHLRVCNAALGDHCVRCGVEV